MNTAPVVIGGPAAAGPRGGGGALLTPQAVGELELRVAGATG
ncbi:hypothetical protein ACIO02_02545 [Streptomyces sp. NPDC087568]